MRVFVRIVEARSFTAAANSMDATPGQTSRSVSDLEAHLRTRLLNRTTRRIALTEAGERYYDHCVQILALIEQAEGRRVTKPDDLEAHSCIHLNTPESPMNRGFYPNTDRRRWDCTRCIYRDNTWTQRFAAGWTI